MLTPILQKKRTWLRGFAITINTSMDMLECTVEEADGNVVWRKDFSVSKEGAEDILIDLARKEIAFRAYINGQNRGVKKQIPLPPEMNRAPQFIRGPESKSYRISTTMRTRPTYAIDVPAFLEDWHPSDN